MLVILLGSACSTINETSKQRMQTGIYNIKNYDNKDYYVLINDDSIALHPIVKTKAGWLADTSAASEVYFSTGNTAGMPQIKFLKRSFDIDVLTILFKYRPSSAGLPNQLNTNFNAAGFIGYRSDIYILSYDRSPLNSYHQRMNRFAHSVGFFIGPGATQINPSMTRNAVQTEYDGVVLIKGIAGLVGVGDFTFGAAIGIDHLMDNNRKVWIYQGKPWVGFTVGFNIN